MNITYLLPENIRPADWRATYILRPDLAILGQSIADYGWTSPIVVRAADMTIIDGFARWLIAQKMPAGSTIPVLLVDCDQTDAMCMHIRLNRGRGQVMAKPLSNLLKQILRAKKYNEVELQTKLMMTPDEFGVLRDGTLLKVKKISEHKYSQAWVPVEAPPAGAVLAGEMTIERPPNADR